MDAQDIQDTESSVSAWYIPSMGNFSPKKSQKPARDPLLDSLTIYGMNIHPIITPASPSLASPIFDASFDSIESLTTSFLPSALPTLETATVTEVALGYHRNGQYSITAITTSTGAVSDRYTYTAYGQPTILNASGTVLASSAVGNRYTYTGREWDETLGLHHFRARWMSPLAGRFLGRDPMGYSDSYNMFILQLFLSKSDPTGLYAIGGDIDRMWGCLLANYVENYSDLSLPDSVRCPFVPLSHAVEMRMVGVVGQIGVGVILASVKHLMPEGLAGKITEAALENILSQMTCDPSNTQEQIKKIIFDQLKKLAGNYIDPQAIKALELIAKQLSEKAFNECKGMTCEQFSFQHGPSAGYDVGCYFNLCKKRQGSTTTYNLSGTCSYKCIKSEICSCLCGTSITTHFSGISNTVEDSVLFSENCNNVSIGTTRILE